MSGSLLDAEVSEAQAAVGRAVSGAAAQLERWAKRWRSSPPTGLCTLARGSSDAVATYVRYRAAEQGILSAPLAPSLLSLGGAGPDLRGALLLAISQSGASEDLVVAFTRAANAGERIAITNTPDSPLARAADGVLELNAGTERSIAATKTFLASLALCDGLLFAMGGQVDVSRGTQLARALADPPVDAEGLEHLFAAQSALVLARGAALGAAQEVALKLKETAGLHAEALSAAEVMHGPRALCAKEVCVLALLPRGKTRAPTLASAQALAELGAPLARLEVRADAGPLPPELDPALLVMALYQRLVAIARARGRDPDRPPHLTKVTSTR